MKEQVVEVELGLKLQENNQNPSFLSDNNDVGGPNFNGFYNGTKNCTTNLNNVVDVVNDAYKTNNGGVRSFHLPSSYYYSSSGGMATGAMGFPFTAVQWKELERQAMIYKYMMASLPIPPDLLYSCFPTNLIPSSPFPPSSYYMGRYGSGLSVRWSGNSKDAEPGRCKRTDGKKWRCSKDVAPNSKYCERHMHRGRPRSRKHVEHQLLQQNNQAHSLSDLSTNNSKSKDNLTRKTRLNDQSIGSCTVEPTKPSIFDQSVVTNANPFEDSRNLTWSDEQQWNHIMETNINPSVFQHQLELEPLNLNSTGALSSTIDLALLERPLFDAWSMGVTETKDNVGGNTPNKFQHSTSDYNQGAAIDEEMCQIHMGLGLIDSWVSSTTTTPGGPLAEVLRPGTASKLAVSDTREGDFVTPPATTVSSPSGVLQKTLATFSDSSGCNSPVCHHNSNPSSDVPFNWLN